MSELRIDLQQAVENFGDNPLDGRKLLGMLSDKHQLDDETENEILEAVELAKTKAEAGGKDSKDILAEALAMMAEEDELVARLVH